MFSKSSPVWGFSTKPLVKLTRQAALDPLAIMGYSANSSR